jgi:hypothetical protein
MNLFCVAKGDRLAVHEDRRRNRDREESHGRFTLTDDGHAVDFLAGPMTRERLFAGNFEWSCRRPPYYSGVLIIYRRPGLYLVPLSR